MQQVLRVAETCTCPQPQGRGYLRFLPVGLDPEYRYGLIAACEGFAYVLRFRCRFAPYFRVVDLAYQPRPIPPNHARSRRASEGSLRPHPLDPTPGLGRQPFKGGFQTFG